MPFARSKPTPAPPPKTPMRQPQTVVVTWVAADGTPRSKAFSLSRLAEATEFTADLRRQAAKAAAQGLPHAAAVSEPIVILG